MSSLIAGLPSSTPANLGSRRTAICRSGRQAFNAATAGVSRTRSPSERKRTIKISEFLGSSFNADCRGLLSVDARFVNQHHRDVFANRVYAAAGRAFQTALITRQLHRSLVQRAHQNVEKFLRNRHHISPKRDSIRAHQQSATWPMVSDYILVSMALVVIRFATDSPRRHFHSAPCANSTGHTAMIWEPW